MQINAWLVHNFAVLVSSFRQIIHTPLPSAMTTSVIGIALALPAGLYVLLDNVQNISGEWGGVAQISLFLKPNLAEKQVHKLADQLLNKNEIASVQVIMPEEALAEYKKLSGFGEALTALESNPLPPVLVIQPTNTDASTENLLEYLSRLPQVNIAQFDMLWLKRLFAIVKIVQRGVVLLAILLCLAVLLVIGNTIRLAIDNRHDEIKITKLVGGTDAFIRRPFLYTGFWYGLLGSLIAWILIQLSFWLLQSPVEQLTALYYSDFEMITLNFFSSITLIIIGSSLGFLGAWVTVGKHLKQIQPH
ncbi:permease-like cell division protein FtsX [Candidatus Marithrix sp. Canyon 246]|uniref:permease-like cell division protein FtsX n=1 Tax=Candidatus Marithrix sp. Canyon 246 TaxID=1827136 RepID=UPI000849FAC7|nr:permease-like cell division protein FtsX [Candidatus Marithrix sp. Canyon 246]